MTSPAATILIVDDEIQNCRLLETLLQPDQGRMRSWRFGEKFSLVPQSELVC